MADTILGLPSSTKFAAENDRFYNHRRKILTAFPQGKAPLTGILSMLPEETTNDSIFIWHEERYISPKTATRGTDPCTTTAPSTGDADDGTGVTAGAKNINTDFFIKVASTAEFTPGQIARLDSSEDHFLVLEVVRGTAQPALLGYLRVRLVRASTFVVANFAAGTILRIIGTAHGEGASGDSVRPTGFKRPFPVMNTTQIFRDAFTFPGSVLQMGLKYDKTGPYRKKAFNTVTDHMTGLERSILFGKRSTTLRTALDTRQEDLSVRTTGGILEFLALWDAGSNGLQIDGQLYAPYSFKGPSLTDNDDQKRIIANAEGTVSVTKFLRWAERVGRYHTNNTNEKAVLCGSGALIAMADLFRNSSTFQVKVGDNAYGLEITTIVTPFGKFHLISHPLFNEDPVMTHWMLFLDVWNLKYRNLLNRDTRLLKNRQGNGDDFRKDEYLTEAGLEVWFPESHMLVKNVQRFSEV